MQPVIGLLVACLSFPACVAGLKCYFHFFPKSDETERKLMHVGTGLCFLPMPWLTHHVWLVAILSSALMFGTNITRYVTWMDNMFRRMIMYERRSYGGQLFGLACLLLFIFARDQKVIYFSALSVVTFADAAAAVVGIRFPLLPYKLFGFTKTLTGSLAFFVVACICLLIPLTISAHFAMFNVIQMSFMIAAIATIVEAISPFGFDNLLIPMTVYLLLRAFYS